VADFIGNSVSVTLLARLTSFEMTQKSAGGNPGGQSNKGNSGVQGGYGGGRKGGSGHKGDREREKRKQVNPLVEPGRRFI
jgi:hypothetical protein